MMAWTGPFVQIDNNLIVLRTSINAVGYHSMYRGILPTRPV